MRLLLLGGNRYNVFAVRAARAAGFFTLVADRNPEAPGLAAADVAVPVDICNCGALLTAIKELGRVDGIVSMAEVGVRPAAALSARLGLPGISEDAARNATSKAAMRRCWAPLGRYSIPFCVVRTETEARRAVCDFHPLPVVFKPDRSLGGSRGVRRVDVPEEVAEAFAFARSGGLPDSAVVVEPLLCGNEHSAEVLIWDGVTSVLCSGRKLKSPFPYRVDLSVRYPAPLSAEEASLVSDMCDRAVAALGLLQGVAHIEFSYTAEGPVLLELGARCGGGHTAQIAAHVSGVDEFLAACRMACGLPPTTLRPQTRRGAEYRFLQFPPGRVSHVRIDPEVAAHPDILDVAVTLAPGESASALQTTADRSGFVVTLGEDGPSATAVADWACRRIVVRYADGSEHHPEALGPGDGGWHGS